MVKKTRLVEYDSTRSGGVIAINLRDGDEVIAALLTDSDDDLLLVSRKGQSARFHADDETLRPMARATQGVIGMRFRANDELLAAAVVRPGAFVVTVTDGGFAKKTSVDEWTPKGRGILGVKAMRLQSEERGTLVGALVVDGADELFAIKASGEVIRTSVDEVRATGRDTMGVTLTTVAEGDAVVAVTRNAEATDDLGDEGAGDEEAGADGPDEVPLPDPGGPR
jgi:DNA gyrase subunit A